MALTVFLRAPILRQRFATRGFHITRPARSAHGDYHVRGYKNSQTNILTC